MLFALGKTLLTEQVGPTPFGETVRLIDAPRPWSASSLSSGEVEASCSWFSPSVTASNRSCAAQESKTRGNAVLKNNKWRTRKVESDKLAAKLVKRSSRIRGKRQREKKMIRFLSSDFSVSRRRTRVDRPKFQLLLAVIIKVGEGEAQRTELLATSRFLSAELFATTELIRSKLPLPMFAPYCGRDKLSPNFLETNRKGKRNEQFSNLLPNTRSKLLISRLIFRIFTQIWNYCTLGSN